MTRQICLHKSLLPIAAIVALVAVGPSGKAGDEKPKRRTMRITVVGPDEKPMAGVKIHASVWTKEPFQHNRDYVCGDDGKTTVELPKTIEILRLWTSQDHHVPLFAQWWPEHERKIREIPENFTFHLEKGITIGGIVKSEDGEPIAGAQVRVRLVEPRQVNFPEVPIPSIWLGEPITDADGRWTLDNVPSDEEFGFRLIHTHADYVSDYLWGGLQSEQGIDAEALRAGTATVVMHRGVVLSGLVTDPDGKPVPDALIIWGEDPYFQEGCQEVRTDEKGHYRFPPLPAGALRVTVVAQGWAPDQQQINLDPDDSKVNFKLTPGTTLRLHFIDGQGAAVGGVGVSIQGWRGGKALYNHKHPNVLDSKIPVRADEKGILEWTWAPEDAVTYSFYKEGYQDRRDIQLTADGETEYEIRLWRGPGPKMSGIEPKTSAPDGAEVTNRP